jgi:pimeloyl-ACP methyl ester carboxylesterase
VTTSRLGGVVARAPASVAVPAGKVMLGARHWPGAAASVPALLVHGLASNARVWDSVAARLAAAGREVLAVDLRGHGGSAAVPDPPGSDPILVAARDLAWVCASLRWSRAVLVGHSWGGNIALQLAADCPDLVAGLALVDGGWLHESDRWGDLDTVWRTKAPPDLTGWDLDGVREVLTGAHPDWPGQAVEATLANLEQRPDGTLRPWLTPERHRARWASLLDHRPRELHRRVRCTAVLLAAGDPPDGPTREAASALADAELVTFPGGEHDLHLQFPDRVAAAIARLG